MTDREFEQILSREIRRAEKTLKAFRSMAETSPSNAISILGKLTVIADEETGCYKKLLEVLRGNTEKEFLETLCHEQYRRTQMISCGEISSTSAFYRTVERARSEAHIKICHTLGRLLSTETGPPLLLTQIEPDSGDAECKQCGEFCASDWLEGGVCIDCH